PYTTLFRSPTTPGDKESVLDQFVTFHLVLFLVGPNDQAGLPIKSDVVVHPIDEDHNPILETNQKEKVDEHPDKPGEHALEPEIMEIHHGLVPAYGGHAALVPINKGFHGLSIEKADQVFPQVLPLLDGGLGHHGMSLRVFFGFHVGHITDGKNLLVSLHLVERVRLQSSSAG